MTGLALTVRSHATGGRNSNDPQILLHEQSNSTKPCRVGTASPMGGLGMDSSIAAANQLAELEERIERGLDTFIDVGMALTEIRDQRLYREDGYTTFEHYCVKRWGFQRQHAYRLIESAHVAKALGSGDEMSPIGDTSKSRPSTSPIEANHYHGDATRGFSPIVNDVREPLPMPKNESQYRELARLGADKPELIREVWRDVQDRLGDSVTAQGIREVVNQKLDAVAPRPPLMSDRTVGNTPNLPPPPQPSSEERAWNRIADLAPLTQLDPESVARACPRDVARVFAGQLPTYIAWAQRFSAALEEEAFGNRLRIIKEA